MSWAGGRGDRRDGDCQPMARARRKQAELPRVCLDVAAPRAGRRRRRRSVKASDASDIAMPAAERFHERFLQRPEIEEAIAPGVARRAVGRMRGFGRREKARGDLRGVHVAIDALDVDADVGVASVTAQATMPRVCDRLNDVSLTKPAQAPTLTCGAAHHARPTQSTLRGHPLDIRRRAGRRQIRARLTTSAFVDHGAPSMRLTPRILLLYSTRSGPGGSGAGLQRAGSAGGAGGCRARAIGDDLAQFADSSRQILCGSRSDPADRPALAHRPARAGVEVARRHPRLPLLHGTRPLGRA